MVGAEKPPRKIRPNRPQKLSTFCAILRPKKLLSEAYFQL
jgi:hypothetical protein